MIIKRQPYRNYCGKRRRKWPKVLLGFVAAGVLCFGILEGIVLAGGYADIRSEPDVMVILGCQVMPWGPSELLTDRLDTAMDYLQDLPQPIPVIVSGGQGADEPTTEAFAMAEYLERAGYDPDLIWLEDRSHNTMENLTNTSSLLKEKGLAPEQTELLVVSNGFHLSRIRMLASRCGLEVSTLAAPSSDLPSRLKMYVREPLALVKSFLFDR